MDNITVSLDVEGVLANPYKNVPDVADIEWEDFDSWNFSGYQLEQLHKGSIEVWQNENIKVPAEEENIGRKVRDIAEHAEVHIVTNRTGCDESMKDWLHQKGVMDYVDEFISLEDSKHSLGYDIYIDDNPTLSEKVHVQFLIEQKWNNDYSDHLFEDVLTTLDSIPVKTFNDLMQEQQ